MFKRILIPLDGSKTAERALPYGRLLSERLRCPVELLQIIDPADVTAKAAQSGEPAGRSADRYLAEVAKSFPDGRAQVGARAGVAADGIVDAAREQPDTLIVMATHGRSGIGRWLLGSVAEKVLRAAESSMLLVRAAETASVGEPSLSSILVPLDGSKLAESALPPALDLARALKTEVTLVGVYEIPSTAYYRGEEDVASAAAFIPTRAELVEAMSRETRTYLQNKTEELSAQSQPVRSQLLEGAAADQIIDLSRNSKGSLIVMCTHGRSGVRRWVLGSVTEKVARHAEAPVLIVRGR